jgi:hypothetical protein
MLAASYSVDIEKTDIKPYRAVKRAILVDTEPSQLIVKILGVLFASEVPVECSTVGNSSATTLVASWLQEAGTSMSSCSKIALPVSLDILAERFSHCSSSKGWIPAVEKNLSIFRPFDSIVPVDFIGVFGWVLKGFSGLNWAAICASMRKRSPPAGYNILKNR